MPELEAPLAPAVPDTPAPVVPITEESSEAADAKEWEDAENEVFPDAKKNNNEGEKVDESAQSKKTAEEVAADKAAAEDADGGEGAETDSSEAPDTSARTARLAARESAQAAEVVKADVRKQMFAETPTQLQDADGDPIKNIEDVMKLKNPRTGEAFTEEEAGMWLLSAQQRFNQSLADTDKQIEQITEVNMDIKDQADQITYNYGELLNHPDMKDLRDQLWTEYEKTLVKDDKSGIIIKAPVSLETFYDLALKPYIDLAAKLEADGAPAAPTIDEAKAKADAEASKQKARQDRSDIYGGGKTDDPTATSEDKEWADAANEVFGPRK